MIKSHFWIKVCVLTHRSTGFEKSFCLFRSTTKKTSGLDHLSNLLHTQHSSRMVAESDCDGLRENRVHSSPWKILVSWRSLQYCYFFITRFLIAPFYFPFLPTDWCDDMQRCKFIGFFSDGGFSLLYFSFLRLRLCNFPGANLWNEELWGVVRSWFISSFFGFLP